MKKLLKYCKFEEDNEDKSDLSTKPLQVKTFEQLEQILFDFLRLIYNCFYGGGDINVFYNLFPLTMVLSHWVFLVGF